jgi:hypothetical protein
MPEVMDWNILYSPETISGHRISQKRYIPGKAAIILSVIK